MSFASLYLNCPEAPYTAITVAPAGPHCTITVGDNDRSSVTLALNGVQFEALRRAMETFAAEGRVCSQFVMDGLNRGDLFTERVEEAVA